MSRPHAPSASLAALGAPPEVQTALRPVTDRTVSQLPPREAGLAVALAAAAFRRTPIDQLEALDPERTVAWLADAVAFADARTPGEIGLRVRPGAPNPFDAPAAVEVNVEDAPFLLSTLTEELTRLQQEVTAQVHPIVGVHRTADGRLEQVLPARDAADRETWIWLGLAGSLDEGQAAEVEVQLRRVMADALVATRDFPAMRERLRVLVDELRTEAQARYPADEVEEAATLLEWLLDDHFVFLGYREYDVTEDPEGRRTVGVRRGSGMGILADESGSGWAEPVPIDQVEPALRRRIEGGELLVVSRTNRTSTVHRQERMIYIGLKRVAADGRVVGERRVLGLFAQKAYAEAASRIPVLRRKLRQILEAEDIVDHSYDERALRALFEALPKHELFAADTDELRRTLVELLETGKRHRVRLLLRRDPQGRSVSALVTIPRERFSAAIRKRIQQLIVDRFSGTGVDYQLSMTDREQALLHFVVHRADGRIPEVDREELERALHRLTRTWDDDLADALAEVRGPAEGAEAARRWAGRFPASYQHTVRPAEAVADIAVIEGLGADDAAMRLRHHRGDEGGLLRFILYKAGEGVELSAFVPILESLGLVVVEEVPHRILVPVGVGGRAAGEVVLHDFGVRAAGIDVDEAEDGERLADAAVALWQGRAETDSLNRLVARAKLRWDDVAVLRAYRRFQRQVGTSFTQPYVNDALVSQPGVTRGLLDLFAARFDPDRDPAAPGPDEVREQVIAALEGVERLDTDRILRSFLHAIDATLRTNRYVVEADGTPRPWLSLKVDSARVPGMPKPLPHVEVFVYHPDTEGVHLRGGPVARGGIRWSDRQEDVRTEVLGLMKAQMTKNAVIVPTGSKGGFVLKHPPATPAALRGEVRRCYEIFIRALLDITDTVEGGEVRTPARVVRADGDDPYLVVAADRGTATFSDLANAISEEYGFWLGDAFASGGSQGYDHKAMGITARGAWVAVQRHFRELNIDVQTDPITVVGIGDMSGDVFGNGLLRSEAVRLVAAFDHRHIFLDPDPDPAVSFAERARLYALPGSSWQDYDRSLLSPGGGVWSRTAKEIVLGEEARTLLRLSSDRLSPPELMSAILRAPVDLLFAGGIGTFVKSTEETHADVGDRANDAVRVDATDVGARVIGEGGNLAVTQRGRIQYARRGGRCNTDAIDNSAGVDTSDREVNLKILLGAAQAAGRIDRAERNSLLAAMADDVAQAVLRDVYLQTWAISQELAFSPGGLEAYEQLMADLTEAGRLDRVVENLPSTGEMAARAEAGAGLTRPELAVLLGYAKVDHIARLLESPLLDQQHFARTAIEYFPPLARERFGDLVPSHRLYRELVATLVANDVVNRMGITYVSRTAHQLGAMAWQVSGAYWVAKEVTGADQHWLAIEALDGLIDPALQLELKAEVDRLVDEVTRAGTRRDAAADVAASIQRDRAAFAELSGVLGGMGAPTRRLRQRAAVDRYVDLGIDEGLATELVDLGPLALVPDVAEVARRGGWELTHVAEVFVRLGDELPLEAVRERISSIEPLGAWQRWQQQGLLDELSALRRTAAGAALDRHGDRLPAEVVQRYLEECATSLERARTMLELLQREPAAGLDAAAVTVRALRDALA